MRILVIIFLLQCQGFIAFSQWTQSSGLTGGSVVDIAIQDSILFIIVPGGDGVFRRSVSQASWERVLTFYYNNQLEVLDSAVIATGWEDGLFRSFDYGDSWEEFTAPYGESTNSIAALNASLFLSSWWGGVFRTDDYGESWIEVLPDSLFSTSPKVWAANGYVYAASGHYADTIIYESADKGNTWNEIPFQGLPLCDDGLYSVLKYHDQVWAGGKTGAFIFNGNDWVAENIGLPGDIRVYELIDINDTLFCVSQCGLFYYDNDIWIDFNEGLPIHWPVGITSYEGKFYCADASGPHWRYHNESWQDFFEDLNYIIVTDLDHSGDTVCACSDNGFYLSYDFGVSFNRISLDSIISCRQITVTDSLYYLLSTKYGFGVSYDKGLHWEIKNSGLPEANYYSFGMNEDRILLGTSIGLFSSQHGAHEWEFVLDTIGSGQYRDLIVHDSVVMFRGNSVYLSQNSGDDYIEVHDSVYDLRYFDERCFALEHDYFSTDDYLHYSNNGIEWQKISIEEEINSYDVVESSILLGGVDVYPASNYLSISYNFGGTWIDILDNLSISYGYSEILFADIIEQRIFTGSYDGSLFYRDDLLTDTHENPPPKQELFLYPNPARDKLTVKLPAINYQDIQIQLFDVFGRSHDVSLVTQSKELIQISISNLSPTIYLIKMLVDNQSYTAKFIKK